MKMIKLRKIFKYNTPCISWISKIKSTLIYNTEDLHVVLPIYNLLEYSQKFLWHQEADGITIETKLMMLMMILQIVNRK